jgi:septum formation topological specificity factor MinE
MNKTELIDIINTVVEARIKKLLPKLIKDEIQKMRNDILDDIKKYVEKEIKSSLKSVKVQSKLQTEISQVADDDDSDIFDINMAGLITDAETDHQNVAPKPSEKIFSKNAAINDIMNSMVRNKRPPNPAQMEEYKKLLSEEYQDMETFSFDSRNLASIANRTAMVPAASNGTVPKEIGQEILKNEIVAQTGKPEIANAMIKDYRAILKKADEIAKQTHRTGRI